MDAARATRIKIDNLFSESEQLLLVEGLRALLGIKENALKVLNESMSNSMDVSPLLREAHREFRPEDFGISTINSLIETFES